jgi:hypothetical protein
MVQKDNARIYLPTTLMMIGAKKSLAFLLGAFFVYSVYSTPVSAKKVINSNPSRL